MFLQFPHGLLYGFESLWCFFTNTGRMAWGQGWRKPVKSSVIQAGRCCGHYPLNPLAPLQLLSTKCSQTGVGGHLSKIWYAEPKGLALLSASETSLQRTLEYCLCSVLLIIYARQQRGCPPSDQLDEFLLWHEALSLSVLLPEVSVRFSSSGAVRNKLLINCPWICNTQIHWVPFGSCVPRLSQMELIGRELGLHSPARFVRHVFLTVPMRQSLMRQ